MTQRPVCGNLVEWELGEGRPGTLVWVVGQARALRVPWCCLGGSAQELGAEVPTTEAQPGSQPRQG